MSFVRQSMKKVISQRCGSIVPSLLPSSSKCIHTTPIFEPSRELIPEPNQLPKPIFSLSRSESSNIRKMCHRAQQINVTDPLNVSAGQSSGKAYTKDDARGFKEIFPDIVRELTFDGPYKDVPEVNTHVAKCLQYNLLGGKMNRGLAVPMSYKMLTPAELHTEENIKLANIVGWCIELMQTYFLVADDIMDGAETRRGKPCWYKKDNIGMMAFNDALIIETCIYSILERHLKGHKQYSALVHAFLQTNRHTTVGQSLDMLSQAVQNDGTVFNYKFTDQFTMKLYNNIVKHKTSYYSFHLPVQTAMLLADIDDPELHRQALAILLETGKFFQVQDDYLDCFGDPEVTGKIGTDIQDGKCSWLIVQALQRASPKQKEELKKHYGSPEPENIAKIMALYEELKIQKLFLQYEEEAYNDILNRIEQMSGALNPHVFYYFLNKIYRRNS